MNHVWTWSFDNFTIFVGKLRHNNNIEMTQENMIDMKKK